MAIENVVKLMQFAQEKPELALKLEAVSSSEQVVEIGAAEGLEFTAEEAETFRQKLIEMEQKLEDGELTEEELEEAAGGVIPQFLFAVATTDTKKDHYEAMNNPERLLARSMVPGGGYIYDGLKASNNSFTGTVSHVADAVYKDVKSLFSGW